MQFPNRIRIILTVSSTSLGLAYAQDPAPTSAAAVSAGAPPAPMRRAFADLTPLLEPIRARHNVPALAGAIIDGEALIAAGATGVRETGRDERVTIDDCFHIGSCTKAMTATLIAMLIEQEKLRWTTTIAEIFPELRESMRPEYRDVTVEQLVTHRGGVPADLISGGLWARLWENRGTPTEQRRALVEGALKLPPDAPPGTKFLYSNAGYAIAGAMAEKITGEPWEALMRRLLFDPLDMKSAGFGAPGMPDRHDQPRGHVARGEKLEPVAPGREADNPPAIGPAGTVHVSLPDWAKFVGLHLRGERGGSKLLSADSFKKLHTAPDGQEYACGWLLTRRDWGGRVLTHAGSNTMWFAVVWVAPEKDFAVLAATNYAGPDGQLGGRATDEAAWALIQHFRAQRSANRP
jgi:CubicO group peptidase (beta-lactamase class C family)